MELQSLSESDNLIQLALKREQTGDISGALRLARQALNTARSNNLPLEYAQALTAIARYRFRLGQYETARELAQEAMEMTDPLQDTQASIHTESLLLLGMCALETNSLTECEQYYRSAANLAREIGHPLLFQRAMHNLGSGVYLFRGQFDLAIAADSQSLQICREKNFPNWAVFPLMTLAIAYQIIGQRMRARETLTELRALVQPGSAGEGYACYVAGMLALVFGQEMLLVLFGQLALGVDYARQAAAVVLISLTLGLWIAALGLLIGALARSDSQVVLFSMIAMFFFAAFGGCWFPLEVSSGLFAAIGGLLPSAWAMTGFQNILIRGLSFSAALQPALILSAYAVATFVLAGWVFKKAGE